AALALQGGNWDLLWVEKELLPWIPGWLETFLLPEGTALVLDYDDAIFHRYDQHPRPWVRSLFGSKIARLMRGASLVIVGCPYLADYAQRAGASRVEVVPTAVDTQRYLPRDAARTTGRFVIGWIGTPYTVRYLEPLSGVLRELQDTGPVEFHFIGVPEGLDLGIRYQARTWSEETEVHELQQLDCGIMPLDDGPFERGKCGYKIIQYFACGVPAVASPVGVNKDIVIPGENGFLAGDRAAWLSHLRELRDDVGLARRLGEKGRTLIEERYSTELNLDRIAELLRSAVVRKLTG
ncbi:MAG: glycosyltransferase family 4 protein, partial [Gammaproteobacteria bacterium]|nr:glycosyltransferase family 4 protein [Gammaproteobacteria bacterium]